KVSSLLSLGFPIRKSPDYRLLASTRGLSQLATSFIAYLRQGIHTHALSSLTIKLTLRSEFFSFIRHKLTELPVLPNKPNLSPDGAASIYWFHGGVATCSCPSITIQLSKNLDTFQRSHSANDRRQRFTF